MWVLILHFFFHLKRKSWCSALDIFPAFISPKFHSDERFENEINVDVSTRLVAIPTALWIRRLSATGDFTTRWNNLNLPKSMARNPKIRSLKDSAWSKATSCHIWQQLYQCNSFRVVLVKKLPATTMSTNDVRSWVLTHIECGRANRDGSLLSGADEFLFAASEVPFVFTASEVQFLFAASVRLLRVKRNTAIRETLLSRGRRTQVGF